MKNFLILCVYSMCLLRETMAYRFTCPTNEIWKRCRNSCQPTCHQNPNTLRCTYICKPGCVCIPGTVRNQVSGSCIDRQTCNMDCPENEVPNYFGNGCEATCQRLYSMPQCPYPIKTCVCRPGLVRNLVSGKCITNEECRKMLICKENEELTECADDECRDTCQRRKPHVCPNKCKPGCTCQQGFLWDEHAKKCISKRECPRVCGKNQDWCLELPHYIPSCQNILDPHCVGCNDPPFDKSRPGCVCIKGFIWDENSQDCVRLEECSNTYTTNVTSSTESPTTISASTSSSVDTTSSTSQSSSTTESSAESSKSNDHTSVMTPAVANDEIPVSLSCSGSTKDSSSTLYSSTNSDPDTEITVEASVSTSQDRRKNIDHKMFI